MDRLIVKDIVDRCPMFHNEGLKLYYVIKHNLELKKFVKVSFIDVFAYGNAFLNASIGQIYVEYDEAFLRKHLIIQECKPALQKAINKVIKNALKSK